MYKELHPTNQNSVQNDVRKIIRNLKKNHIEGNEYTLNITGGTKIWALVMYIEAKESGLPFKFIYVDQTCLVSDLDDTKGYQQFEIDSIETVLRLNGIAKHEFVNIKDVSPEDKDICARVEGLIKMNKGVFLNLVKQAREDQYSNRWKCGNNYLNWDRTSNKITIKINNKIEELQSINVEKLVIKAGWFEYKVASILNTWKYTKEMYLGVNIEDNQNEIDIIINAGEKLVFVECKTKIFAITDLDKFNEVARKYSGTATVKLFVQNERLEDDVREKCKRGISAFSFEENGGMFNEKVKENLFELLDAAMLETHTK
jgi:Holliday junction resolvase-like predicted endonuclease